METTLRVEACDHVENIIDEMRATNIDHGEHGTFCDLHVRDGL